MTHRKDLIRPLALTLASGALMLCLTACSGEEPAPPQATRTARPAPPPPAPPRVASIEQLMARLGIDERIMLAEEDAPATEEARIAVLEFFDGFARGDAGSLRSSMQTLDQMEFDALVESGLWEPTVENIELITIQTGPGPYGEACAMAIFEVAGDFQPQLWYMQDEPDGYIFEAAPTPPNIMDKLYGDDHIAMWHEILKEEITLGNEQDVTVTMDPVDLDDGDGRGASRSGGTSPSASPGGGGNAGRRKPRGTRPAPGPGG